MKKMLIILSLILLTPFAYSYDNFMPIQDSSYFKAVVEKAEKKQDFDKRYESNVLNSYQKIEKGSSNINYVYNYGRNLYVGLRDKLSPSNSNLSKAGKMLLKETEDAYRYTLEGNENHGRANIMLGMLLNDTGRYSKAFPYLIKGMKLPQDSNDWLIASSEFVKAAYYTRQYKKPVYRKSFARFKQQVSKSDFNKEYYESLVKALSPYFEG